MITTNPNKYSSEAQDMVHKIMDELTNTVTTEPLDSDEARTIGMLYLAEMLCNIDKMCRTMEEQGQ